MTITFRARLVLVCLVAAGCFLGSPDARAARKKTGIPRFDAAVEGGYAFLVENADSVSNKRGFYVLAAYALFKCDKTANKQIIDRAVEMCLESVKTGQFVPELPYDHIYECGLYTMFLADIDDGGRFRPQLQIMADYVQQTQKPDGSWTDPSSKDGDVSMCQYAMLALWACQRVQCKVNPETIDRSVAWFMRSGNADGGWGYRPGTTQGHGGGASTRNMTVAANSALGISRFLLHGPPNAPKEEVEEKDRAGGLLKRDTPEEEWKPTEGVFQG
ncbi:MAG: terpene cyclase/mutase family protein, partial [Planctomycetaceae bacterium]|nr:terpene cyclase/mutase family protein [Planctomycetaceae bacterium]